MLVEYIWLDANQSLRSKTKVINYGTIETPESLLADLPEWNYDGSSTGQGSLHNSEVIIKPVACYDDPFRRTRGNAFLVLCETFNIDGTPHSTNTRNVAAEYFNRPENISKKA